MAELNQFVDNQSLKLLGELLQEAAQLEHCLLNTYLYAASSLKSTPQEFEQINGKTNRRRAIHFERVRAWKKSILEVAHEEMLHLHYVQCMLRGLGNQPCLHLPPRDSTTQNWVFGNWKAKIGTQPADLDGKGLQIPLEDFSLDTAKRFLLYESTNSLQDGNPYSEEMMALYEKLFHFELEYYLENALFDIEDATERNQLKDKLRDIYLNMTPVAEEAKAKMFTERILGALPPLEELHFQSIADLYIKGIQPLYEQAFEFKWVKYDNIDLTGELKDKRLSDASLVPIGPVYRSKNFESQKANPLRNFMNVKNVISEIVEQGEGFSYFKTKAEEFLKTIDQVSIREYITAVKLDKRQFYAKDLKQPSPPWLVAGQGLRRSHLYRFAMIMAELQVEQALAQRVGLTFDPVRSKVDPAADVVLENLAAEIPDYFNACYLVLVAWLGRIYEVEQWHEDQPRRKAIEMLVTWPMMSMSIRPFLELATLLPVDISKLFLISSESIPTLPIQAQQLYELYASSERSQAINERMDFLAISILAYIASWAKDKHTLLSSRPNPNQEVQMMINRLEGLSRMDEFEKQFPFRMYGGYSEEKPSKDFAAMQVDANKYEEDPGNASFEDTFMLRLKFAGWGKVQLSTDPDPPTDEAGSNGTIMLHADDGNRRLNRALVWQNEDPANVIVRQPAADLPALGVNVVDVAIMYAAKAQPKVDSQLVIPGLLEMVSASESAVTAAGIKVNLLDKNGAKPHLIGDNHLIWKDGEPIDPFILSLSSTQEDHQFRVEREIFNDGKTIREMNPVQRIATSRWPLSFDGIQNVAPWARPFLGKKQSDAIFHPKFPQSYLDMRGKSLATYLKAKVDDIQQYAQSEIDAVASTLDRLDRILDPPRPTTAGFLTYLLHYGHSVSGKLKQENIAAPLDKLFESNNLHFGLHEEHTDRKAANSRWIVKYGKGAMDVDSMSDFVLGELYIPVVLRNEAGPVSFSQTWTFTPEMEEVLKKVACRFNAPFWAAYEIDGSTRRRQHIVDTLVEQTEDSYRWTSQGITGVDTCNWRFSSSKQQQGAVLTLSADIEAATKTGLISGMKYYITFVQQISDVLTTKFVPQKK